MISEQIASRASLMLANEPKMWIFWSASTIRVRVAFSMAYLVLPSWPAIRPMARLKWSPLSILTSLTSNVSMNKSSNRSNATASCTSKPIMYAWIKSAPFCNEPESSVNGEFLSSIHRVLVFIRICSFKCSTIGVIRLGQSFLSGVYRCAGTRIRRKSFLPPAASCALKAGKSGRSMSSCSSMSMASCCTCCAIACVLMTTSWPATESISMLCCVLVVSEEGHHLTPRTRLLFQSKAGGVQSAPYDALIGGKEAQIWI